MKLRAAVFVLLGAVVGISGVFGSNGEFQSSRRLQQIVGVPGVQTASRTQICNGSTCTTTDEDGVVISDEPGASEAQCLKDCASLESDQIQCIEACTSGSDSGISSPGAGGSSRSVSCVNGKCTVKECDESGNCTTEEVDPDEAGTRFPSGAPTTTQSNGTTSSSASVRASSGPGGVETDVQTSGDGARGRATASNGTVTETTSCEGEDCETTTAGATPTTDGVDAGVDAGDTGVDAGDTGDDGDAGEVQNVMGDDGATDSGDGGAEEVTSEPEAETVNTSGVGTERGVATGVLLALMAGAALLGM